MEKQNKMPQKQTIITKKIKSVVEIMQLFAEVERRECQWYIWTRDSDTAKRLYLDDKRTFTKKTLDAICLYKKQVPKEIQKKIGHNSTNSLENECKAYLKKMKDIDEEMDERRRGIYRLSY